MLDNEYRSDGVVEYWSDAKQKMLDKTIADFRLQNAARPGANLRSGVSISLA